MNENWLADVYDKDNAGTEGRPIRGDNRQLKRLTTRGRRFILHQCYLGSGNWGTYCTEFVDKPNSEDSEEAKSWDKKKEPKLERKPELYDAQGNVINAEKKGE